MSDNKTVVQFKGSCLCGAVQYEISGDPAMTAQCCCTDCQKASGTGHITAAFFPAECFSITGDVWEFSKIADSGNTITRLFCPSCGGRLFARSTARPGMMSVMAGSLDNGADKLQPQAIVYVKRHHGWDQLDDALPTFDEMPPPRPK